MHDLKRKEWDTSYINRDNFVFYPHEEIIRFVSRFIRKRTGLNEFTDVISNAVNSRILDIGCGIGRHVIFCHEMGLKAYGIDISAEAIDVALKWAKKNIDDPEKKIINGDIQKMPWANSFFDFVVSHGVLDSMSFNFAQEACRETARILKPHGLFYCDLISGDDSEHAREYSGEETITALHENGTVQSYFNYTKINKLINGYFKIIEAKIIRQENVLTGNFFSRYHLVLKNEK